MNIHIPNAPLKALFFLHLTLIIWAGQASWLPSSYLFYNSFFLLTILWTLHIRDSEEGPFMAVCINALCVILDGVTLIAFWPYGVTWGFVSRLGAVAAVGNIFLRPVSGILLYRVVQDRAGTYGNFVLPSGLDGVLGGNRRAPYEDIDQAVGASGPTDIPSRKDQGSNDGIFST